MKLVILIAFLLLVGGVEKHKFKTCSQSGFCKRNRLLSQSTNKLSIGYEIPYSSVTEESGTLKFSVKSIHEEKTFVSGEASLYSSEIFHFLLDEYRFRYEDLNVSGSKISLSSIDDQKAVWKYGNNQYELIFSPLQLNVYANGERLLAVNDHQLMNFERKRERDDPISIPLNSEEPYKIFDATGLVDDGLWEETFREFTDTKPYGPTSVGIDFTFTGPLYGIPEHADCLQLRDTSDGDPYRLYNLDVFDHDLNSRMALYGSVPFIMSKSIGMYWNNPSETWVDIKDHSSHWFSESGVLEFYIITEENPISIIEKFTLLTGPPALPPLWSLGYHQSRWNYSNQTDVMGVLDGFIRNEIPLDSIWLDIEHTPEKMYFRWDLSKFSDPEEMQAKISDQGKKLITIVDPHLKRKNYYPQHKQAMKGSTYEWWNPLSCIDFGGHYVKDATGEDFVGNCWPGSSSWPDFVRPTVQEWWASQFSYQNYEYSTKYLHIWNDMNEPSVFSGPEITMPKDNRHGEIEHREVHNLYGTYMMKSTYEGLLKRDNSEQRPFVLSRAFFPGTSRYGAVWTGDNKANYEHLVHSVPMMLSIAIGGISFCGADIGGYFKNPSEDLLVQWYQLGAFYPFMRAHCEFHSHRREPWLFSDDSLNKIREAVLLRYQLLPYWYSLFYTYSLKGTPVIRPMFVQFPLDSQCDSIDDQFMLGDAILVAINRKTYLPGQERWFDYFTWGHSMPGWIDRETESVKVFLKGGNILPRQDTARLSTVLMKNDPYTFLVVLDQNGYAKGKLFKDDGISFKYQKGEFISAEIEFSNKQIQYRIVDGNSKDLDKWNNRVDSVVIIGLDYRANDARSEKEGPIELEIEGENTLVLKPMSLYINESWTISIE